MEDHFGCEALSNDVKKFYQQEFIKLYYKTYIKHGYQYQMEGLR
jgi:hypothetical protein